MPELDQPADETPLYIPSPADGAPNQERTPDATAQETGPAPAPVEQAITEVGSVAARSYDAADSTINSIISSVSDTLSSSAARAERAVVATLNSVDTVVGEERNAVAGMGVPIPFGPGAVAAELADPEGRAIVQAVQAGLSPPPAAPAEVAAGYQENIGCGWYWSGSEWTIGYSSDGQQPDPMTRPTDPGRWPADFRPAPCVTSPPASPPVVVPPGGVGGTLESSTHGCAFWTIGPDVQDPQSHPLATNATPYFYPLSPERGWYWYVWETNQFPGKKVAYKSKHILSDPLPPGVEIRVQLDPDPDWIALDGGDPCVVAPAVPPSSPPPAATCPPPTTCCPPQTINVTVSPPAPPPVPPATKPDPDPVPPTVPPEVEPPEVEPAEAPKPIGVTGPGNPLAPINWDNPVTCAQLDSLGNILKPVLGKPAGDGSWQNWATTTAGKAAKWIAGFPGTSSAVASAIGAVSELAPAVADVIVPQIAGNSLVDMLAIQATSKRGTNAPATAALLTTLGLAGTAERMSAAPLTYLFESDRYAFQALNPQYIPDQSEVDRLYLTNRITNEYWECLTKANGNLPELHRQVRDSKRTIPNVSDVINLKRRSLFANDAQFYHRMYELGVTDPAHADEFFRLMEYVPPPTDLTRFMVRDVFDEEIVRKYQYDKGFTEKFVGKAREWAAAHGMTEEQFLYVWRAKWKLPSPTQLYHMYHRLRPDRPAVAEWEFQFRHAADPEQWAKDNPRPPVVTREDIRESLMVNDEAPGWIEPLIEVAYHPLTNTDARRAFEIGFFNRAQLKEVMLDNGYNPTDAETLTRFFESERNKRIGASTGVMSPRSILKAYRDGEVSRADAFDMLGATLPDPDVRQYQLNLADQQIRIEVRRMNIAAVKKGYVYGEYDDAEAVLRLEQHGIPGDAVGNLIARFKAARDGHKKEPRVQLICQWYTHRLITREEYFDRLLRLGYSSDDAGRISEVCHIDRVVKERAAVAKAAEAQRREARSNLAELRRQIAEQKKVLAELEKRNKEARKEQEKNQGAEGATPE